MVNIRASAFQKRCFRCSESEVMQLKTDLDLETSTTMVRLE